MITEINLAEYYLKKREIAEYFTDENKTDAEAIADAINNAVSTGVAQSNSNTSYTPTVNSNTSGSYKIGSIKLNGTTYDIYGKDTDTKYSDATTTQKGLMSSNDKAKLDGLNAGNIPFTKNNDTWGNTSADNIKSALDSLKNSCNSLQNAINNLPTPIYYDGDNSTIKKDTNNKFYIPDKSITNTKLADTTIQTGKIQDNAITNAKLANTTIQTGKIQDGAITNAKLANTTIQTGKIQDGAITNSKIADNAIGTDEIINKNVTNAKIADNTITGGKISTKTITNDNIADSTITGGKISTKTITNNNIADNTIEGAKIANTTIGNEKLKNITTTITKDSGDLITSGTIYNAFNTTQTPFEWDKITDITTDTPSRSYAQQMWYNYVTGMVELYIITPYRKIGNNHWNWCSFLVENSGADTAINGERTSPITAKVSQYVPYVTIYATGKGLANNVPVAMALDKNGNIYVNNNSGLDATNWNQRYVCYFTYRCNLNRQSNLDTNLTN